MRLQGLLLLVAVSACTHAGVVRVKVRAPTGTPLPDATVACVCEPSGDAGAVTGGDGLADLTLFNSEPKACIVTAAKIGYEPQQRPDVVVCPSAERCQAVELVLPPVMR